MAEGSVRVKNTGLRGVAVADTKISYIDGENGVLLYRGFRIEDLAKRSSFMETAYLLLEGSLPGREELQGFEERVASSRALPPFLIESMRSWPKDSDPMDVLQAAVPLLGVADPDLSAESREANVRKAIRLIARLPSLICAWHRIRQGLDPVEPDPRLGHAENFLHQLHGSPPDPEMSRDLDVCLILHADHTFNASTFACREVVSTRAHMYAGVAAGVGALSGSLHGGANARVMRMLSEVEREVESIDQVEGWVKGRLERGEKIMGMGHAVYKTFDPRALLLRDKVERLAKRKGYERLYELLAAIDESSVRQFEKRGKRGIKANVDFYSGLLFHMMGIPLDIMTPMFVFAIVSGWCAHIIEEKFAEAQEKPALYRPQAEYVGDYCGALGCEYEPIESRRPPASGA